MATDRISYYADVHIARAVAEGLERHEVNMVLGVDLGNSPAADDTHLAIAHAQNRVLVTQDEDFLSLHAAGHAHSGIAYFRQGSGIGHIVSQLLLLHAVYTAEEMRGRVEFL